MNLMPTKSRTLIAIVSLLLCATAPALQANTLSPGIDLLYETNDPNDGDLLFFSRDPIFSPDGKHLYFARQATPGEASVLVYGLTDDELNEPFFIRSFTTGPDGDGSIRSESINIRAFNASGSHAYATIGQFESNTRPAAPFGTAILSRDEATGDLNEIQSITEPRGIEASAPVASADGRHVYVSTYANSETTVDTVELRRYRVSADTGRLLEPLSINLPTADALRHLRLVDNDTRLLASSSTALVEYQRDVTTGELTLVQTTPLPTFPDDGTTNDGRGDLPGPVSSAVTSDGRFVYTVRVDLLSGTGGYINAFARDPATGSLSLTNQLLPSDFGDNGLFLTQQALLTDDEEILLVPSAYFRFFAGSPSPFVSVNAFAIDKDRGTLRRNGTYRGVTAGVGWAPHPQTDRFYSSSFSLPNLTFPGRGGPIGVWQPGRIVQPSTIHSAVLPISRTVGELTAAAPPVTYFASVLNPGPEDAESCFVRPKIVFDDTPLTLLYQVNDLVTNEPLDEFEFNQPFDVPAGGVTQLTLTVDTTNEFPTSNIELQFSCLNSPDATVVKGVNSFLLSSSTLPLADMITGVVTAENNGIARLPGLSGTGFFAASTINIGAEAELRAVPVFDLADLIPQLESGDGVTNASLRICETNPTTGECLSPPAPEISRRFPNQDIATYTVFIVGNGSDIALDPARNRVFIAFVDEMGEVRGASSVAVTTSAAQ